eukprot:209812-Prymnesium_polylepis.1
MRISGKRAADTALRFNAITAVTLWSSRTGTPPAMAKCTTCAKHSLRGAASGATSRLVPMASFSAMGVAGVGVTATSAAAVACRRAHGVRNETAALRRASERTAAYPRLSG